MAPIMAALESKPALSARLIHTGQHYDYEMDAVFFEQLGLPAPDRNLEVGSASQTQQTARIMEGLEHAFGEKRTDAVLVVGDVNSTLAAALVAAKMQIPLAHVEAGLRSGDRTMPEEINRLVTDRLSNLLFTTERKAGEQLRSEGVAESAIHFVGNVMIDCLLNCLDRAIPLERSLLERGFEFAAAKSVSKRYALVTLHRPSNVDDLGQLRGLLEALGTLSKQLPVVFTIHPRTKARIESADAAHLLDQPGIFAVSPLSYFEMLGAMRDAAVVVTDSGGIQEETTALAVPCLTVRENTERPITISEGTNRLVGLSPEALLNAAWEILAGEAKTGQIPELWDGQTARRIASVLDNVLA